MKKVLLTLIAVLMAVPAFAIEVYNNGEGTSVDIYGTIRGYVGYGHGAVDDGTLTTNNDDFLYGLQGNSRIGVKMKVGNFSGQVELGANEKTMYNEGVAEAGKPTGVGLRQAWGAYTFGSAGQLLFGKTETPTSMSGFSSDFIDTDGGGNGFGGNSTSNRRYQMQYNVMGLSIAIIEDDLGLGMKNITNYTDGGEFIPRLALSYTYKGNSLNAKVGATYSAVNGKITGSTTGDWATIHAFGIVAGVKPTFMDGKMWLSVQARYGMNEELYGEAKTVSNNGAFAHTSIEVPITIESDGTIHNTSRVNVGIELGYKVTEQFAAVIGGGYQLTMNDHIIDTTTNAKFENINSYSAFIQGQYFISKNFAIIPQLGYYGNSQGKWNSNALLLAMQARVTF